VSFNVTALVQAAVNNSGSRWSRLALLDVDTLTDARARYCEHYNLLATIEQSWALPRLGKAAGAAVMKEFFK
jgi:hypothetical protein